MSVASFTGFAHYLREGDFFAETRAYRPTCLLLTRFWKRMLRLLSNRRRFRRRRRFREVGLGYVAASRLG